MTCRASTAKRTGAIRLWVVGGVVLLLAAAGGVAWYRHRPAPPAPASATPALWDEVAVDVPLANPGYVGPQACAPCHAARVAEFQGTRHFRACREPRLGEMPTGFEPGRGNYAARDPNLRFELTRKGGEFFLTALHQTDQGLQRRTSPIAYIYGTGTADEIYFTWHGDGLFELPVAWLHPQARWGEQPYDPYSSGDFSRPTTPRCIECHNTWFAHLPGTANRYHKDGAILGTTCEKCHGPGAEHVAYHKAHPDETTAHAVVHPGRLSRDRQLDVCAQCHSNAVKRKGPAFTYRPGEPLERFFQMTSGKYPENDHVANQDKYLRESKCFQKSDTLTCVTCHNPHRPASAAAVAQACRECHQPADCREQPKLPAAVRDRCVDCHMPNYSRVQVFFHTGDELYLPPMRPHQHRIGVYPVARQTVVGEWLRAQPDHRADAGRLGRELAGHWKQEGESLRRAYRFLAATAAFREALRFEPEPGTLARLRDTAEIQARLDRDLFTALHQIDQRQFPEALATLKAILEVKPDGAKAHGRLGTVYAITGDAVHAKEHLEAVEKYDADDAYGLAMLGWLAYLGGRYEEAVTYYRRADAIEPFDTKITYHGALALAKLGRWPEAAERFRRVLETDPSHAGGAQGLADALRRQGKVEEALLFARRASGLTHGTNADVLLTLADCCADAGRIAEADAALSKALDVAEPAQTALIRARRDQLKKGATDETRMKHG